MQKETVARELSADCNIADFDFYFTENLPADFSVWLANLAADFLKGRMFSVNWDVEEMQARAQEILERDLLKPGVRGYLGV